MLVNYERRIVLFTPFKNCSSSLHDYFGRDRSWINVIGPQPFDGLIGYHTNVLASWWRGWEVWLPIRNPYDRVRSMWKFCCSREGFVDFSQWVENRLHDAHFGPVTTLYPYTRLIQCERLSRELHDLGCDYGDMPRLNVSEIANPDMIAADYMAIEQVHAADFLAGGY